MSCARQAEVSELRDEFHRMVTQPEGRPAKVSESAMPVSEFGTDPFK